MENPGDLCPPDSTQKFFKRDANVVREQIALHMQLCSRAWVGYGQGRVVLLKDSSSGKTTYFDYEDGVFVFYDGKGGKQIVRIEEITEISGY